MKTPSNYTCSVCKAGECKLWRQYNTFANHVELMCAFCAGESEEVDVSSINAGGMIISTLFAGCSNAADFAHDPPRTDQIGNLVPAAPTEDGTTFWGYTSVPSDVVAWWKALPNVGKRA